MIPLACGGRDAYLTPMNTTETPLFKLRTEYLPTGDQPAAIEQLASNIEAGVRDQVLLGVTGSGKTFTVANVIAQVNRPALVLAPNKTLAAQLYNEFRALFPENAVEYFLSYYDYYQPMFPRPIRILKRTRPSMTISTSSGTRLPMPC